MKTIILLLLASCVAPAQYIPVPFNKGAGGGGSASIVQSKCAETGGAVNSLTVTMTSPITSGNAVVVMAFSNSTMTVAGNSGGESYTSAASAFAGGIAYGNQQPFYKANSAGGYSDITVTFGASSQGEICGVEISGVTSAFTTDAAEVTATGSNNLSIGPYTSTVKDVLVGAAENSNDFGFTSPGGGFTLASTFVNSGRGAVWTKIQTASGSDTLTATSGFNWASILMGFKIQ